MKTYFFTIAFSIFFGFNLISQTKTEIKIIKHNFKAWQPIIKTKIDSCDKLYNYSWGNNYQFSKWTYENSTDESFILTEAISIIKNNKLGFYVKNEIYSLSGDWFISADFYFDKNQKLYFIFWKMNSFQAEQPVTIEKRLYFNKNGELIKNLKSVYKINTKKEINVSYRDIEVDYHINLKDMDFYNYWITNK